MSTAPVYVAIDTPDPTRAEALVKAVGGRVAGVKLGLEFFVAHGPKETGRLAAIAADLGLGLFLDLKFHDIPNTVAGAVRSALALRPRFLTLHASGGAGMIAAAAGASKDAGDARPQLLAVTVLTSFDDDDLTAVGQAGPVADQVVRLGKVAVGAGADGLVASPGDVARLRRNLGPDAVLMIPGIRPAGAETGDQKRVATPRAAIEAGATYLVIGRPITAAADPAAAAAGIANEIAGG